MPKTETGKMFHMKHFCLFSHGRIVRMEEVTVKNPRKYGFRGKIYACFCLLVLRKMRRKIRRTSGPQ